MKKIQPPPPKKKNNNKKTKTKTKQNQPTKQTNDQTQADYCWVPPYKRGHCSPKLCRQCTGELTTYQPSGKKQKQNKTKQKRVSELQT